MAFKFSKDLKLILHPYMFVLKEGKIQENMLDYSLMMLQVSCPETIKSPSYEKKNPSFPGFEWDFYHNSARL
ncbi:hypothetical protein [Parachlamydia sp. AcF125]|uniref:hypothetical protein n=1 Tax=Parachlamydia sp. AcF125 TaxID=2795736 RepID=UPI001BD86C26|nr:hypothetical protein [Parachlamydia sp. AcF125]MBS4169014.1 hypothetical protein [Parachlamydia sp. AcF125]